MELMYMTNLAEVATFSKMLNIMNIEPLSSAKGNHVMQLFYS